MKHILSALTDYDDELQRSLLHRLILALLLFTVFIGWGVFLNWGEIPFDYHDWAEVNAPRLAFLKDAVTKKELPLHMPDSSALRGVTDRFMALPDMILSPQVLLLHWLSVGQFVLVHTWLMIFFGFIGLLRLKERFSLSLLHFSWLCLLFYFNGHILSHYAVGHVTWGGYFLLSWFVEFVCQLMDGDSSWGWTFRMAFLLFFTFLQGSFHQFVWCVLFLGFYALANFRQLWAVVRCGIFAALFSAVRIIPPAMQMGAFDDDFLGGYRTPSVMLKALARIILPKDSLNQAVTGQVLGWWEFDLYIGWIALLLLLAAGLCWISLRDRKLGFPQLLLPIGILVFFSFRNFYELLRFFQIPLFSGERVSSRFLILPFVFLLVISIAALQRKMRGLSPIWNCVLALLLIPVGVELFFHLRSWKVTEAVKAFPYTFTDLSIKTVANHPDPEYTTGLWIGLAVSILSLCSCGVLAQRRPK